MKVIPVKSRNDGYGVPTGYLLSPNETLPLGKDVVNTKRLHSFALKAMGIP